MGCNYLSRPRLQPPLKLGHEWIITSHCFIWESLLTLASIRGLFSSCLILVSKRGSRNFVRVLISFVECGTRHFDRICQGVAPDSNVHGANMGPPGSCRPQMGPMLAPWTLLSGVVTHGIAYIHEYQNGWYKQSTAKLMYISWDILCIILIMIQGPKPWTWNCASDKEFSEEKHPLSPAYQLFLCVAFFNFLA